MHRFFRPFLQQHPDSSLGIGKSILNENSFSLAWRFKNKIGHLRLITRMADTYPHPHKVFATMSDDVPQTIVTAVTTTLL